MTSTTAPLVDSDHGWLPCCGCFDTHAVGCVNAPADAPPVAGTASAPRQAKDATTRPAAATRPLGGVTVQADPIRAADIGRLEAEKARLEGDLAAARRDAADKVRLEADLVAVRRHAADKAAEVVRLNEQIEALTASMNRDHDAQLGMVRASYTSQIQALRDETAASNAERDGWRQEVTQVAADLDAARQLLDEAKADLAAATSHADELARQLAAVTDRRDAREARQERRARLLAVPPLLAGQIISWFGIYSVAVDRHAVPHGIAWLVPIAVDGVVASILYAMQSGIMRTTGARVYGWTVLLAAGAVSVIANYAHAGPSRLAKLIGISGTVLSAAGLKLIAAKTIDKADKS